MMGNTDISTSEEEAGYEGFRHRFADGILGAHIFGRVLYIIQTIVGYTFVVCLGLCVGRILGGYIGSIHAENIQHTVDFLDFNQLRQWQDIPWTFARTGAAAGILIALTTMRITQTFFLRKEIVSLCEEGVTGPADIANILGESERKIRRRMRPLIAKGIIAHPGRESAKDDTSKAGNGLLLGS